MGYSDARLFCGKAVLRYAAPGSAQIIKDLHASVKPEDPNSDAVDNSRGTLLLEILALEIQMYTETKNNKRLRVRRSWTTFTPSRVMLASAPP